MRIDKKNIEIERYEGVWSFSHISDYILSITSKGKYFVVILQDISVSENVTLVPLKISPFFMEFFVQGSLDNMRIRIFPKSKSGKIGVEIKDKELFFKKSGREKSKDAVATSFTCQGDVFPDWITGHWKCYAGGLGIHVRKKDDHKLSLGIVDEDGEVVNIHECGYIGHSGMLLTLSGKNWIDPPQKFEILFDSFKEEIACYIYVMPPIREVAAHVE
ncbi:MULTISPECIES: hypothetical protein [unclassified Akkermansia]|jgi:hypothetical protein|uniref:hypothetical protein n=1 Tax=unclassified Akkermansia TaxID=2608915 RepID=UPI00079817D4|nr:MULTISPECIES: hypothetical protein [unclassified Akkermansia]KXT50969.1 hypothetical protein HMPREF3038_01566 [Akkermansia sp. KLE1797]KXU54056.1 hypothetical protein HMPREF3039_01721 [Akkermansia sp. KLE1798]KZA05540.1 hypothetical protein HMPREF1326_00715 [Akkermansia sp. KLE1605]